MSSGALNIQFCPVSKIITIIHNLTIENHTRVTRGRMRSEFRPVTFKLVLELVKPIKIIFNRSRDF